MRTTIIGWGSWRGCQGQTVKGDEVPQDYVQHESNVIGEEIEGSKLARRFSLLFAPGRSVGDLIRYIKRHR